MNNSKEATKATKRPTIVHLRSIRLRNNAGMNFPTCYAGARLLDCDKGYLPTTGEVEKTTCKRCLRIATTTLKWIYGKKAGN